MEDGFVQPQIEEIKAEQSKQLRAEIRGLITQYAKRHDLEYWTAWQTVYRLFERETGLDLQDYKGVKLDLVEREDKLGTLYRICTRLK